MEKIKEQIKELKKQINILNKYPVSLVDKETIWHLEGKVSALKWVLDNIVL